MPDGSLGTWNGYSVPKDSWEIDLNTAMDTITFQVCTDKPNAYEARGVTAHGTAFTVIGVYERLKAGTIQYTFTRTYTQLSGIVLQDTFYVGTLHNDGQVLFGEWGEARNQLRNKFTFERVSQAVLTARALARPPDERFKQSTVRARWSWAIKFAFLMARSEGRVKTLSPVYLQERRVRRMAYLNLLRQQSAQSRSLFLARVFKSQYRNKNWKAFVALGRELTYDDVRLFQVMTDFRPGPLPTHR